MAETPKKSQDAVVRLLAELKRKGADYVRFETPDLHGVGRSKLIPIEHVEHYARTGLNMYGGVLALDTASSVVPGALYNEQMNYADQRLVPDLDTLAPVPWLQNTWRLICDGQWENGKWLEASPRRIVRRLLGELDKLGYIAEMAHEFEFYILERETQKPLFSGVHIFNNTRNEMLPVIRELMNQLRAAGLDMMTANVEYSPSQFELVYRHAPGMRAADNAFTYKNAVKEIVTRAGLNATFMSKPAADIAGCGAHFHISLLDKKTGKNAMLEKGAVNHMSPTARHFVQGLMDHGRGAMALFGPTPNCYHRLKPHTFAPSNISWGVEDRSAMVRVKYAGEPSMHVENRVPSGLANPYLTVAGTLACALLGLKEKRPLQPSTDGPSEENPNLEKFPRALEDSLAALESDKALCKLLGEEFVSVFGVVKRYELARFRSHITDWERAEYLDVY
ncbi:MAG: glutamine synthetase [Alphaproteobacteria bacterium]|nr:glutamine synthetase [Alphaproteobacteria bacterium]